MTHTRLMSPAEAQRLTSEHTSFRLKLSVAEADLARLRSQLKAQGARIAELEKGIAMWDGEL